MELSVQLAQALGTRGQPRISKTISLLFLVIVVLASWLACTVAQVEKYLSLSHALLAISVGAAFVVSTLLLLRFVCRTDRDVPAWCIAGFWCLLVVLFAGLYPRSLHHVNGKGSDREDALRVEWVALVHHQYPYDARTFLGHPPTPLPGAILLAGPFYAVRRIALQNLFWTGLFCWFLTRYYSKRATAVLFVLLFLITALENLNDIVVGGDYVINSLYVAIALWWFTKSLARNTPGWQVATSVLLLGLALCSRIMYILAIPPVLAFAYQQTGFRRATRLTAGLVLVIFVVSLPVFSPYPLIHIKAQLAQNSDKLRLLPHIIAQVLPWLGLAVSCLAFTFRMTLSRVYALLGLSTLVLLLPPMVAFIRAEGDFGAPLTPDLEYLSSSAILLSLWALSFWESLSCPNHIESEV